MNRLSGDDRAAQATAHMKRGLALMADADDAASVAKALEQFDLALELRRSLPRGDARTDYALAASWMNRAEALLALGETANNALALDALDEAVVVLETLPLDSDPRFARRLAIALQNRALARRRLARDTWTIVPDLFRALDLVTSLDGDDTAGMIATMWVNIGSAQLFEPTDDAWRRAMTSARQALRMTSAHETSDMAMMTVGLQARHLLCRAAARCLESSGGRTLTPDVHAATDAVDEALALVSAWEARGVPLFRALAVEIFEFGRRVYEIYQPQFVDEFEREYGSLRDNRQPSDGAGDKPTGRSGS